MPKVDEIDFKTGEPVTPETGQAEETKEEKVEETKVEEVKADETKVEETKEETEVETKVEETEDVESLPQWAKDRLKKTEDDKENYKKGLLKYKSRTLTQEETKTEEEDYPDWDETSKKFQEQTTKKASQIAEQKARQIVEGFNEKAAINSFVSKHPELDDDNLWKEVITNYNPKNGKESIDAIQKDLERAYFTTRFEKGEISELETKAFKKGEQKGKSESAVADLSSVSKTTSKSVKESGNVVSSGALKLAERMNVDTTKLAAEDDSLTAEIKY